MEQCLAIEVPRRAFELWMKKPGQFRTIMDRTPTLGFINLQVAAAYRNKKDYPSALGAYNALLKADPGNEKAEVGIAMTGGRRGEAAA